MDMSTSLVVFFFHFRYYIFELKNYQCCELQKVVENVLIGHRKDIAIDIGELVAEQDGLEVIIDDGSRHNYLLKLTLGRPNIYTGNFFFSSLAQIYYKLLHKSTSNLGHQYIHSSPEIFIHR